MYIYNFMQKMCKLAESLLGYIYIVIAYKTQAYLS
jgi:hypothetical protein